jgi:hypothetical protein
MTGMGAGEHATVGQTQPVLVKNGGGDASQTWVIGGDSIANNDVHLAESHLRTPALHHHTAITLR